MSNLVYPSTLPGLTWPVTRLPTWKTKVDETSSGREFRQRLMLYPRWLYRLKYAYLRDRATQADYQTLAGFFNQVGGDFDSFLFDDVNDNAATNQQFGLGDGATRAFQLARSFGGFVEPVYDLNGAATIKVAGVTKTLGVDYTLSAGLVTFTVAPAAAAVLTWSGGFYWRCRFTMSQAEFSKFMSTFWELGKVEFKTVKP